MLCLLIFVKASFSQNVASIPGDTDFCKIISKSNIESLELQ